MVVWWKRAASCQTHDVQRSEADKRMGSKACNFAYSFCGALSAGTNNAPMVEQRLSVLSVGDGDLSFSLALYRAYSVDHVAVGIRIGTLVATTLLPNEDTLIQTYPTAAESVRRLTLIEHCTVLYGVDATQLHVDARFLHQRFDYIFFHHPHLGYQNVSPTKHNNLHTNLLKEYFSAARQLLTPSGFVHVCLCGKERQVWQLDTLVDELGLKLVFVQPASRPLLDHSRPQFKYTRTRRAHWLGRYGYIHQPTDPATTTFSPHSNSQHYFLQNT